MEEIENKEYCSKCGGYCCRKCGCDYSPADFEDLSFNGLLNTLNEGNISVVSTLDFRRINGKLIMAPLLYLRARNINRDVIDLLSFKTTCSMLREDGCFYEYPERPTGGKNLVPAFKKELCYL